VQREENCRLQGISAGDAYEAALWRQACRVTGHHPSRHYSIEVFYYLSIIFVDGLHFVFRSNCIRSKAGLRLEAIAYVRCTAIIWA